MGNKLGGLTKLLPKTSNHPDPKILLSGFNINKIMRNSNTVSLNSNVSSISSSPPRELTFEEKSHKLFEKLKLFNFFINSNLQIKAIKNNTKRELNAVKLQKLYNFFLKEFAYSVNQNATNLENEKKNIKALILELQQELLESQKELLESQKAISEKIKIHLFRNISENNLKQLKVYISRILKNNEKFNYQSTSNTNLFKPSLQNKNIVHYLLYELQKEGNTLLEYASSQTSKDIYNFLRRLYIELPYIILLECFNQNNNAMNSSFTEVNSLLRDRYIITEQNMERLILNSFNGSKFKLLKYLIEIKFKITDLIQYLQSNTINYNRANNKTRNIRTFMQSLKQNDAQKYTKFMIFLEKIKKNRGTAFEKSHYYN